VPESLARNFTGLNADVKKVTLRTPKKHDHSPFNSSTLHHREIGGSLPNTRIVLGQALIRGFTLLKKTKTWIFTFTFHSPLFTAGGTNN